MDTEESTPREDHKTSHCQFYKKTLPNGYIVNKPVGKGRLATVWDAAQNVVYGGSASSSSNATQVAIKVFRCEKDNYENIRYYTNEVKILQKLFRNGPIPFVAKYDGTFAHVEMKDDTPWVHPCIVFELLGDSLSKLIKYCVKNHEGGLPMPIVKKLMSQLLQAVAHIHAAGIIHTDIKPSNILLNGPVTESLAADISIKLADFGSSTIDGELFTSSPGTTGYIAPELIIDETYNLPIDIWSAFTVCYEMITGNLLFDVYDECKIQYGEDVDGEAMEGLVLTSNKSDEPMDDVKHCNLSSNISDSDSGSSGDEGSIDEEKIHYRYLLLIAKVIGYPSRHFTAKARKYYNRKDKLLYNPDVTPISISDLLMLNCSEMDKSVAIGIEEFLLEGLKYNPDERITAQSAITHRFLIQF